MLNLQGFTVSTKCDTTGYEKRTERSIPLIPALLPAVLTAEPRPLSELIADNTLAHARGRKMFQATTDFVLLEYDVVSFGLGTPRLMTYLRKVRRKSELSVRLVNCGVYVR